MNELTTIVMTQDDIEAMKAHYDFWDIPCGAIFEFEALAQAEMFAESVKKRFGLACRVFATKEGAELSHLFPWEQHPPVVHVDRPDSITTKREDQIIRLAKKFGGEHIGN